VYYNKHNDKGLCYDKRSLTT